MHVTAEERASSLMCVCWWLCSGLALEGVASKGSVKEIRQAWGSLDSVTGETSADSLDGAGQWHWTVH